MVNSEGEAETAVAVAVVGSAVAAIRYAHAPIAPITVVAPAATTKNATLTPRRSGWIGLRIALIVSIPIVAPLPYVAAHVIQAKFVGFLGCNRVGLAVVVLDNTIIATIVPFP